MKTYYYCRFSLLLLSLMFSLTSWSGNGETFNEDNELKHAVRSEVIRGTRKWDLSEMETKMAVASVVFSIDNNGNIIVNEVISDNKEIVSLVKSNLSALKITTAVPSDLKFHVRLKFLRV